MEFGDRKKKILSIIIEKYIQSGLPVGSKAVCGELDISLSSATVRNEMAELSDLGYLNQPHTSAGRIPSYLGYRVYVDKIMKSTHLSQEEKSIIDGVLYSASDAPESLLASAVKILSKLTNLTAVITTPPGNEARIRDIQFVKTGRRTAMLILMTTTGIVKNRLFRCNYEITDELLNAFRDAVNDEFKGKFIEGLNLTSISAVYPNENDMFILMSPVINALMEAAREAMDIHLEIAGETNLLTVSELSPVDVLNMLKLLRDKKSLMKILMARERGINVLIGKEELYPGLKVATIITERYSVAGRSGAVALIGPTRVDYQALISKINYVASSVGSWLGRILEVDE